jgi:hypothetical protein
MVGAGGRDGCDDHGRQQADAQHVHTKPRFITPSARQAQPSTAGRQATNASATADSAEKRARRFMTDHRLARAITG